MYKTYLISTFLSESVPFPQHYAMTLIFYDIEANYQQLATVNVCCVTMGYVLRHTAR